MRTTKWKLSELSVENNVIIPIPQYDRGPTDPRNILGLIEEVSEYGYRVGISVGTWSWYLCRNQIKAVNDTSLSISMIPSLQISLREAVRKILKTGGQGYLSCKCKGGCKTSKCKCKKNISCVIHVVMVLWHAQTSQFENWKLIELKVFLTWFCKILLMCFEQLQIGKKLYKL